MKLQRGHFPSGCDCKVHMDLTVTFLEPSTSSIGGYFYWNIQEFSDQAHDSPAWRARRDTNRWETNPLNQGSPFKRSLEVIGQTVCHIQNRPIIFLYYKWSQILFGSHCLQARSSFLLLSNLFFLNKTQAVAESLVKTQCVWRTSTLHKEKPRVGIKPTTFY